jgi:hypothetical protein
MARMGERPAQKVGRFRPANSAGRAPSAAAHSPCSRRSRRQARSEHVPVEAPLSSTILPGTLDTPRPPGTACRSNLGRVGLTRARSRARAVGALRAGMSRPSEFYWSRLTTPYQRILRLSEEKG